MYYTYRDIIGLLRERGIEDAQYEARVLISELCGIGIADILADPTRIYESDALTDAVERRVTRYPLQYIIGEVGFCHGIFSVNESTLIPRPDTEMLVEYVSERIEKNGYFADLCTGSGCIAVSVLMNRPDLRCVATDICDETIATAKINAERNGVADRIELFKADVNCPEELTKKTDRLFDAIISNPPYIPSDDIKMLDAELGYEPHIALDGGKDGMDFYRNIIDGYRKTVKKGGFMFFEIGYDQREAIISAAADRGLECRVERDLGGNDRMAVIDL